MKGTSAAKLRKAWDERIDALERARNPIVEYEEYIRTRQEHVQRRYRQP